jgi:hypothetical protein
MSSLSVELIEKDGKRQCRYVAVASKKTKGPRTARALENKGACPVAASRGGDSITTVGLDLHQYNLTANSPFRCRVPFASGPAESAVHSGDGITSSTSSSVFGNMMRPSRPPVAP